jgi:mutator protein MutT
MAAIFLIRRKWTGWDFFTRVLGDEGESEKREMRAVKSPGRRGPSSSVPISHHSPLTSIDVAAGLVFRGDKLLITQRYPDAHLGGLWEFPGGKRELNETFENCLVRELREELGIEVQVGRLIESVTHTYPEQKVHLKFFRCTWKENEPQPHGCLAFRWISRSELRDYVFPAADAVLLETLRDSPALWVDEV